ncbi:MAG: DUF333 domain-containing protein [Anaerolineae bacterium]|nr:DUF333 domain-containing protein [Anaerolineae bacterium]
MGRTCILVLLLAAPLLTQCAPPPVETQQAADAAIANPASVYCQEKGGRVDIRETAEGQVGYCVFADGSECEEWAYFRGECQPGAAVPTVMVAGYVPLDREVCQALSLKLAEKLGVPTTVAEAPFVDYVTQKAGQGCQISASGGGDVLGQLPFVHQSVREVLGSEGWEEDIQYAADGVTGTASGFRKGESLCLVNVSWQFVKGTECGDQASTPCEISPDQQKITVVVDCATTP